MNVNMSSIQKPQIHGFTLIEVLVAVVVFSFGLLGIAGMMTISVKNNHNGYLRTQANFLAENMMDRMRANPTGIWRNNYNGTADPDGATVCTLDSPCEYSQLASYDTESWARSIAQYLPNGQGTIQCVARSGLSTLIPTANSPSVWFPAPPFDGECIITVQWNEADTNSTATPQTLTLIGQP